MRPRSPVWGVISHVGVAALTAAAILLARPGPAPDPQAHPGLVLGESHEVLSPPAPSEMSVDLRGGAPPADGRSSVRSFTPRDRLGVVVRHNGRRSDQARLLVRVQLLSGTAPSTEASPEIYVALDPRRVAWQGQSLHYEGRVEEILPLGEGLWRLTFMISDPDECAQPPFHTCARADAWLRVLSA